MYPVETTPKNRCRADVRHHRWRRVPSPPEAGFAGREANPAIPGQQPEEGARGETTGSPTSNRDDFAPRSAQILRGLLDESGIPAAGAVEPPPTELKLF